MGKYEGRIIYGKKKIKEDKKQKIELIDKIRDDILKRREMIENEEDVYLNNSRITAKTYTDLFKVSYGEVDKCLMTLHREGLISGEYSRVKFRSINYDSNKTKKEEPKKLIPLLRLKKCPICDLNLETETSLFHYDTNKLYIYKCASGCYAQKYDNEDENIWIFDETFHIRVSDHNSVRGSIKKDIEKKIKYWKTNYRYLAKKLIDE